MATTSEHEARLATEGRRQALGAWYTPGDVVEGLLDLALDPILDVGRRAGRAVVAEMRVIDPACGDGNFVVAAASRIAATLIDLGDAPGEAWQAAVRCVRGVDLDRGTVDACRTALAVASEGAVTAKALVDRIVVGDALALTTPQWVALEDRPQGRAGFDLVIGNPPFRGQLRRSTAHGRRQVADLRARFGDAVGSYTDPAALFLVLGTELARPDDGVVAFVQPLSVLAARDAGAVRRRVLEVASLDHLWVAAARVFDASVDVCAPILRAETRTRQPARTAITVGRDFTSVGGVAAPVASAASWSRLLAAAIGLPQRDVVGQGTLADLASATADFRDQYYGLAAHVVDDPAGDLQPGRPSMVLPALVTVGLIDPAHLRWGDRSTRFNKAAYVRPIVRRADLDPELAAWATARLVPKVLVATQTKVLEVVVDASGTLLPSVPVITVVPASASDAPGKSSRGVRAELDRIGALLTSPPVTVVAAVRHLGAGQSRHALKLRAAEVLDLPLPVDDERWDVAAAHFRAASDAVEPDARRRSLIACGRAMNEAFGLGPDPELLAWWVARLPS